MPFERVKNFFSGVAWYSKDVRQRPVRRLARELGHFHPSDPDRLAFGASQLATKDQIDRAGCLGSVTNSPMGRSPFFGISLHEDQTTAGDIVHLPGDGHILVTAPTRAGKGVTQIIPNLLTYHGSVVVNDIKGENYAITSKQRRKYGRVFVIDPFKIVTKTGNRYNPMDYIRDGDNAWTDARDLAGILVQPSSSRHQRNFWELGGVNLLSALILFVKEIYPKSKANLASVRKLYAAGSNALQSTLETMRDESTQDTLRREAAHFLDTVRTDVRADIVATLKEHTDILESPQIAQACLESDFQFSSLKRKPTTVYVVIPPEHLITYSPFLRLVLNQAVMSMTRTNVKPELPVWFMLDEFLSLGKMPAIEDGMKYLATYGAKLWIFLQDLPRMREVYGKNAMDSFLANADVQLFFGTRDHETAKLISDQSGTTTFIHRAIDNDNKVTPHLGGRPLISPQEVRELPSNVGIMRLRNLPPIALQLFPYFEDQTFSEMAGKWHR